MRTIRFFLASALLSSIVIAQFPAVADCQIILGSAFANCVMPCCKSIPMPKCPHVRAVTPKDSIAASPISFTTHLQALFTLASGRLLQPVLHEFTLERFFATCRSRLVARTLPARAPPSEYILLSA